jgi:hypothetical protein
MLNYYIRKTSRGARVLRGQRHSHKLAEISRRIAGRFCVAAGFSRPAVSRFGRLKPAATLSTSFAKRTVRDGLRAQPALGSFAVYAASG